MKPDSVMPIIQFEVKKLLQTILHNDKRETSIKIPFRTYTLDICYLLTIEIMIQ
jgi:hypothetical protein